MINPSSSKPRLDSLKAALNKWRVAFLVFALAYAVILAVELGEFAIGVG